MAKTTKRKGKATKTKPVSRGEADTKTWRLIAAASEMLAALKYAVAVDAEWRREHRDPIRTPECQESYDRVVAAIAKAEA